MKRIKLISLFTICIFCFTSCEDDDTSPSSTSAATGANGDGTKASLIGTWEGYAFKGDDGVYYGLNERIPYYETDSNGCEIYNYSEKYQRDAFIFANNDTVTSIYNSIDGNRSYTVTDPTNCTITYGAWVDSPYNDTFNTGYRVLSASQIEIRYMDYNNIETDTVRYSLINGVLEVEDIRYRK